MHSPQRDDLTRSVIWQNLDAPGVWQTYVADIRISSPLYISRHFSSSATFYFGPFQPLRTSDALSKCNIAVRLRARAASTSIFASFFFAPLTMRGTFQRNLFPATLQPDASHAFSLSTSCDRIRCQNVMSDRSRRYRIKTQKLSHTFLLDTRRYEMLFSIQFARNILWVFFIMQSKGVFRLISQKTPKTKSVKWNNKKKV